MNKLYFAEDNDTTPDHADDLEQVLLEAGLLECCATGLRILESENNDFSRRYL